MSPFYGGKCGKCGKEFESYEPTSHCISCTLANYRTVTKFKDGGLVPMQPKHKHAEFIKAWADGIPVQWKSKGNGQWIDLCVTDPVWNVDYEFRLKPIKITRWLWAYKNSSSLWRIGTRYLTAQEASAFYSERKKLDFTEMEFDE